MGKIIKIILLITIFCFVLFNSCKKDDEPVYLKTTIKNYGFDFSTGKAETSEWTNSDGRTTLWQPGSGNNPDYPNNNYIWWMNSHIENYSNRTKDLGEIDITTVKSVNENWDTVPDIIPLLKRHVYVAKCLDGYVKFKVLSTKTTVMSSPVEIEYYFSSTENFDE